MADDHDPSATETDAAAPARTLLQDAFGRVHELVGSVLDGADASVLAHRPDPEANTVAWLVWHLTRVQDEHLSELAGRASAWDETWGERYGLDLDPHDTGYAADAAGVAALDGVTAEQLTGYHEAVHERTAGYLAGVDAAELARVVDEGWDPPVTASARLVSVIGDCLQHLGQAGYVRGLAERAGG